MRATTTKYAMPVARRDPRPQGGDPAHLSRVTMIAHLSGSIAHELSQPLTAILGNGQAALRMLDSSPTPLNEVREILEDIVADGKRAGQVLQALRLLLSKGEPRRDAVDANEVVNEVMRIAHSRIVVARVTPSLRLAPGLPRVMGDRVQLQQVVLNLVVNACEAMAQLPAGERRLDIASEVTHGFVSVSVADAGPGFSVDIESKMFEPFFTTKDQGLGMGLAICRNIAAAHGGYLSASRCEDGGAVFRFSLPVGPRGCP